MMVLLIQRREECLNPLSDAQSLQSGLDSSEGMKCPIEKDPLEASAQRKDMGVK